MARFQTPLAGAFAAAILASSCAHRGSTTAITRSLPERSPASVEVVTIDEPKPGSDGPAPVSEPLFDWPVDSARMTRGFMPARRRPHLGIDLAARRGTPILASRGGTVIYRGRDFRGFGRMILIESGDGWATLYAHLDSYHVEEGQRVAMGEFIGSMGRTGRASGTHLHFEIRRGRGPVDPLPLLPNGWRR